MPELHTEDGARLHYTLEGTGGPFVLFLHGALAAGAAFRGQLPALRDATRVILLDQRGHGRSTHLAPDESAPSIQRLALDAHALMNLLSPNAPVHLVGASMGGLVAARVAQAWPDRVGTLTLLSTPSRESEAPWRQFFASTPPDALPLPTQRLAAIWHGPAYWQTLARALFAVFANPPPDSFATSPAPSARRSLVMQGNDDTLLEAGDADAWAQRIAGEVTVERVAGDHTFFADGRAGTTAANGAIRAIVVETT